MSATPTHCGYCLENADTLQGRDLFVQVVRAEHLPAADVDNTSDPYCVVWLGGAHSHKTAIVRRTNNPTWNETVMFTSAQLVEVCVGWGGWEGTCVGVLVCAFSQLNNINSSSSSIFIIIIIIVGN